VHILDKGILSMLPANDRPFEVRKPEDQAMLLENFVVSELIRRYSYADDRLTELGHLWQPKGEIDIVTFRNGGIQHAWVVTDGPVTRGQVKPESQGGESHVRYCMVHL
jgi:predicted AAA+ superfamily ATPase